jgi:hypothetical protein
MLGNAVQLTPHDVVDGVSLFTGSRQNNNKNDSPASSAPATKG